MADFLRKHQKERVIARAWLSEYGSLEGGGGFSGTVAPYGVDTPHSQKGLYGVSSDLSTWEEDSVAIIA